MTQYLTRAAALLAASLFTAASAGPAAAETAGYDMFWGAAHRAAAEAAPRIEPARFSALVRGGYGGRTAGRSIGRGYVTKRPAATRVSPNNTFRQVSPPKRPRTWREFNSAGAYTADGKQAHHIVPKALQTHPLVQRATKGGFNINERSNGVLLQGKAGYGRPVIHSGSHPNYTARVKATLDGIWDATKGKKLANWEYAAILRNVNRAERANLLARTTKLN